MKTGKLLIAVFFVLAGCNSEVKKENAALKEQAIQLKEENAKFRAENEKMVSSIDLYQKTLNEVDDNLKSIDINASAVGKIKKEGLNSKDQKQSIMARIATIKDLLDNSKFKVLALDKNLKELRQKYGDQSEQVLQLNKEIKEQTRMILQKEAEFIVLTSELKGDLEELQKSYEDQVDLTKFLGEILNRAFYYVGTAKELKDNEIVDTEGGFIGIGRVKIVNANGNEQLFTQIKKDATEDLKFKGKSIKIITDHADGSYTLESTKDSTKLTIVDKVLFWKNSNYLVIQTQ